jgi:chemotaxis protein methyltransferase CheR
LEGLLVEREFAYTPRDFERARALIRSFAGISLSREKTEFVYARLARCARRFGASSIEGFLDRVAVDPSSQMEFVNALTTNLTAFFREPHHFELLEEFACRRPRPLRVWSAACSTGEEAYSIAMTLLECDRPPAHILATDVDSSCIERAMEAIYPLEALEPMAHDRRRRWFLRGTGENEGLVRAVVGLRERIEFRVANLAATTVTGGFDVIFCRNVLIYFDRSTQRHVLERLYDALVPGGLLMIGHAEHATSLGDRAELVGRTCYQKR